MPQLEPLNLRITGNANGLSAELGRAQRDVNGFNSDLTSKAGGISSMFAGIGGSVAAGVTAAFAALAAGAAAAAAAIKTVFNELDKIADKSDDANKLGIGFTELRGLEFALSELSGLNTDAIDDAIQKLLVGLDEARTKASGPVKDALDRLGLDAAQLLQAGPVEALKQIAEQTRRLGDPTLQLGIAYDLFGKNAAGMVNALRAGSDAIEESYNFAAKHLGLTEAQVAAAEAASDAWARTAIIIEGIVQTGSAELAPLFKVFLDELLALSAAFGGTQSAIHEIVDGMALAVGFAKDWRELMHAFIDAPIAFMQDPGDIFSKMQAYQDSLEEAFSFDSGQKLLDGLNAEREAIQNSVNERLKSRQQAETPNSQLEQSQDALLEQQRMEAEKQEQRHRDRIKKFDDVQRSLDRLLNKETKTPTPVDL